MNLSQESNQILKAEVNRINFDTLGYQELVKNDDMVDEWNVIMSKPSSIEKSKRNIETPLKIPNKKSEFKVIKHSNQPISYENFLKKNRGVRKKKFSQKKEPENTFSKR